MKLVISEYLRTLCERDELDRLLPDLLLEMGYTPIAKPQKGNRQYGVDLAARGTNPENGIIELLLLVIKQGDIGRAEWDNNPQSVRTSLNEIFDVYLKSSIAAEDNGKPIRIVLVTNGELKQVIQANWSGFSNDHSSIAQLEFWGADRLSELIEAHLLNENSFRDQDRRDLRRALALCSDGDYDLRDFHRLCLRVLGLKSDGSLTDEKMTGKALSKAMRIVNFSAKTIALWAINDGDARIGLRAMERALLWAWHRIQLLPEEERNIPLADDYTSLWLGYMSVAKRYFEKLQQHCFVEDGIFGYYSDGAEFSLVAFEQIGILATIGLSQIVFRTNDATIQKVSVQNADAVADALAELIKNNGICSSPCLDRHSQDITLAMMLLLTTSRMNQAKDWLKQLVRNVDYAFKVERYVPISTDSLDDLVDDGGWRTGKTDARLMKASWMLATLAGWCGLLGFDEGYEAIQKGSTETYTRTCIQLWHPDENLYKKLYFELAHFDCGASEAPIQLPVEAAEWRAHMRLLAREQGKKIAPLSLASQAGLLGLDLLASRHFHTPISPYVWYNFIEILYPERS